MTRAINAFSKSAAIVVGALIVFVLAVAFVLGILAARAFAEEATCFDFTYFALDEQVKAEIKACVARRDCKDEAMMAHYGPFIVLEQVCVMREIGRLFRQIKAEREQLERDQERFDREATGMPRLPWACSCGRGTGEREGSPCNGDGSCTPNCAQRGDCKR